MELTMLLVDNRVMSRRARLKPARSAKPGRREAASALATEANLAKERALLDAAARLLARHGPDGFNVRAVAKAVGASTMVIYTRFGGRDGRVDALRRDSLSRLGDTLGRRRVA